MKTEHTIGVSDNPREAPWVLTYSGRKVQLRGTDPETIEPGDIAHGLARICRYHGQVDGWYSVADHSVLLSRMVPPDLALTALLHDAAEAYLGDVPAPVKACLQGYQELEHSVELAVAARFGTRHPLSAIKADDVRLAELELEAFFGREAGGPPNQRERLHLNEICRAGISGWGPVDSEWQFRLRLDELTRPVNLGTRGMAPSEVPAILERHAARH